MDIYPDDLAPADQVGMRQVREGLNAVYGGSSQWSFLGAVIGMVPGIGCGLLLPNEINIAGSFFLTGGAGAAAGCICGYLADRKIHKKQCAQPLTIREVSMLRKGETDLLRQKYLGLLSSLISARSAQEAAEAASIRAAVRDISLGLAALPGQPPGDLLLDAGTLNTEAAHLSAEAAEEQDPVVAASLHRQAEARRQRAEAVRRSAALARRDDTLRQEMLEHVRALRTLCGAAALEEGSGNYDMTILVENIKQIASEAKSLAGARQELAEALPQPEPATVALTNAN